MAGQYFCVYIRKYAQEPRFLLVCAYSQMCSPSLRFFRQECLMLINQYSVQKA